jgi:hypothetical protein
MCVTFVEFQVQFGYPFFVSNCKAVHTCKSELHLLLFVVAPLIPQVVNVIVKEI